MHGSTPPPAEHTDRVRWNARYAAGPTELPPAHDLAALALSRPLPDGPMLDLACGPSGSALLAARAGRAVCAVDISETALGLLDRSSRAHGVRDLISPIHADLASWHPDPGRFALVLCTGFWDRAVFGKAVSAVAPRGLLAWEAFTSDARRARPGLPARWCLGPGEPARLLPPDFVLIEQRDVEGGKRRLLAERRTTPGGH